MSGRPWLEALKVTIRERGTHTEKLSEKILEALPSEGAKGAKAPPTCRPRSWTRRPPRRYAVRGERRSAD
jgi:hypothetical protein